jgi:hypothetical protein
MTRVRLVRRSPDRDSFALTLLFGVLVERDQLRHRAFGNPVSKTSANEGTVSNPHEGKV